MSLFNKKKKQPEPEKKEFKQYISGAGGSVVTRSLLEGKSKLKWLFREDSGLGNGWVAFGDSDSQDAMPRGKTKEDFGSPGIFTFFDVDAGMACFADTVTSQEYYRFVTEWYKANQGKNIYDDYFAGLLQKSYEEHPEVQRSGGDFLCWKIPEKEYHLVLFASGMGDGIYSGYWGLDADGEAVELVIPFLNPEFF